MRPCGFLSAQPLQLASKRIRSSKVSHKHPVAQIDTATQDRSATLPGTPATAAINAIRCFYETSNAATHGGTCAHHLGRLATDVLSDARKTIARFVNAAQPSEIVFTSSVKEACYILATAFAKTEQQRRQVIVTSTCTDDVIHVWNAAARTSDIDIRFADVDEEEGSVTFASFAELLSPEVSAIVLPLVDVTASILPYQDIIQFASSMGISTIVDATNSLSITRPNIRNLQCDYVILNATELGAPDGAFIYGKYNALNALPPVYGGENTLQEVSIHQSPFQTDNWAHVPERFETGMPSLASVAAIAAAAEESMTLVTGETHDKATDLGSQLHEGLQFCPGVQVYGSAQIGRAPFALFSVADVDSSSLLDQLSAQDVTVTDGTQGARHALIQHLKVPSCLRIQFDPLLHDEFHIDEFLITLTDAILDLSP